MRHFLSGIAAGCLSMASIVLILSLRPAAEGQGVGVTGYQGTGTFGMAYVGTVEESFQENHQKGAVNIPRNVHYKREVYKIPESFGNLVAIEGREFWFVDKNGTIRNVYTSTGILKIERILGK